LGFLKELVLYVILCPSVYAYILIFIIKNGGIGKIKHIRNTKLFCYQKKKKKKKDWSKLFNFSRLRSLIQSEAPTKECRKTTTKSKN
jgi:hypothetical protein